MHLRSFAGHIHIFASTAGWLLSVTPEMSLATIQTRPSRACSPHDLTASVALDRSRCGLGFGLQPRDKHPAFRKYLPYILHSFAKFGENLDPLVAQNGVVFLKSWQQMCQWPSIRWLYFANVGSEVKFPEFLLGRGRYLTAHLKHGPLDSRGV